MASLRGSDTSAVREVPVVPISPLTVTLALLGSQACPGAIVVSRRTEWLVCLVESGDVSSWKGEFPNESDEGTPEFQVATAPRGPRLVLSRFYRPGVPKGRCH